MGHSTLKSPPQEYTSRAVLQRILGYVRPYRWPAVVGLIGVVAGQALAVLIPRILRFVIDRGVTLQDQSFMLQSGLLVVGLGVLRGIAGFLGRYLTEAQSHKVAYDIRNDLYKKVQQLPFGYHDSARTGSLITRGISDVDEIQRFLGFGVFDGINTTMLVIFAVSAMLLTSPVLAVIAVLPLIPLGIRAMDFARFVEVEWRKVMERLSNLGDHLQENLVGAEVVRAFAREGFEIDKFSEENERLYHQQLKVIRKWSGFLPFAASMTAGSIALTLIFGGIFERSGSFGVTVGVVVQFNAYILLMSQPIRFSGFVIMLLTQGIASGRRVFEVIDEPLTLGDAPDAYPLPQIQKEVCFEDVNFSYGQDGPQVLHNITIEAKPDDIIALVGRTGSGKSTLANLIPRFYDVSSGRITMDGHDLRAVTLDSLRNQIGIVMQESLLFSATIRENIAFGRPNASEERIIAAAKAANAHDFITEFTEGYETLVGERGVTLSGGQRQRVAIARALVMDPRILILDDATSSVDTHTEHDIQAALNDLMAGRITFIVAQRLTSVLHATQILVLDGGRIVERGAHDDLLGMDGVYKEIYDLQLADQERVRRETLSFDDGEFSLFEQASPRK